MVTTMMRKERLRYAILREIDRQTVRFEDDAIALLVETAARRIDEMYSNEDARGTQAERAEKNLMPVIQCLAALNDNEVKAASCRDFLANPSIATFPWTSSKP